MTWVIKHFLTGMHRRSHTNRIRCSTVNAAFEHNRVIQGWATPMVIMVLKHSGLE